MSDDPGGDNALELLGLLFQAHPWHGVSIGPEAPRVVTAYIEIVPTDTVKYEIDKASGHLKVDRPQQLSNVCPTLYGLIPRTFCGARVAAFGAATGDSSPLEGDGDPMDICVLSERQLSHGGVLLQAVPLGGLRLIDRGQADDKIVAVLKGDAAYGHCTEIHDLPEPLIERLKHYFLTYKLPPGVARDPVQIPRVYGAAEAREVIERSRADYRERFPQLEDWFVEASQKG
ncbi:MAG TPA: inorganic pyrophosphatase [Thermoanaerobaculia bacterium]|jgi:inorganic pyrophosphatase